MLGSAAQNVIVLCDNLFLYRVDALDFAAIGLIGAFYLVISSIGYGFSRGGQVLVARKHGEKSYAEVGKYFQALLIFELIMALFIFLFIQYFAEEFFAGFIESDAILSRSLAYIYPRSWGIFFSFLGVSMIALYTGIASTKFILYDTLLLTISNVILNYIFIFGAFGIEPMGIRGAALASTISEVIAFAAFVIYMAYDKRNRIYGLWNFASAEIHKIKQCYHTSYPIVLQSVLGLGSYFLFFIWIENVDSRNLEISNLIRNMYLILSIPTWGYSAGINTIVSSFIGKSKRMAVIPMIRKTSNLNIFTTMMISIPVLLFPTVFLQPLFGGTNSYLIEESRGLLLMLLPILFLFSVGSIYLNGLTGTGHTKMVLKIQFSVTVLYILYSCTLSNLNYRKSIYY
jgi:multidrug resistance protein, MATE family